MKLKDKFLHIKSSLFWLSYFVLPVLITGSLAGWRIYDLLVNPPPLYLPNEDNGFAADFGLVLVLSALAITWLWQFILWGIVLLQSWQKKRNMPADEWKIYVHVNGIMLIWWIIYPVLIVGLFILVELWFYPVP